MTYLYNKNVTMHVHFCRYKNMYIYKTNLTFTHENAFKLLSNKNGDTLFCY